MTTLRDTTTTAAWTTVDTPDGAFTVIADADGVVLASGWTDDPTYLNALVQRQLRPTDLQRSDSLSTITSVVEAYYAGDHTAIDSVAVVQRSGDFIESAWAALRTVPAGEPITYTGLAELAGGPRAVRAAASACARNAAALFVPCHRVLRTDGKLGGFRYGLPIKKSLLGREALTTRLMQSWRL